ncbi:9778_t:CDS:2 [Acaulospora morrowiae]|uniref:9778_t:CDS:1 n=1 Tax=Acaulospora morrowiae TaxID=94023 RepID=A0A9N9FNW6_9GLOM|nr:9778_t:CDS:2 [Acaulospora morrowiae]
MAEKQFLDECNDVKTFHDKIGYYLTSLETIIKNEDGERYEKALQLYNQYKQAGSRILLVKIKKEMVAWQGPLRSLPFKSLSRATMLYWPPSERRQPLRLSDVQVSKSIWVLGPIAGLQRTGNHETAGASIYLHNPIFKGSSLGIGTINGGTFNAESQKSKKRNREDDYDYEKCAVKKCEDTTPTSQIQENQMYDLRNREIKNYAKNISSVDEPDLYYLNEQTNDEDEENSLDDSSDEEDTFKFADISFLLLAIEEMKQSKKVDSKIMSIIWLGQSSIIDLSSEFKRGMHSWFNDDWIPLKTKALSKINLTAEEFSGELLEFITKVENV